MVEVQPVSVAPTFALLSHVSGPCQLSEDPVGRTLGDPDVFGQVADTESGVHPQADQDVSMVRQECPRAARARRRVFHGCLPTTFRPDRDHITAFVYMIQES